MIYATAISFEENDMKNLKKIVRVRLKTDGKDSWTIDDKPFDGWYEKEWIHGWLKKLDNFEIKVDIYPYPLLEPVEDNGTKYVRSKSNNHLTDNLLELPKYTEN
ncbi:hypothetical protein [Marinilactibacillus psychrotolerans]|uniref:hypothetical protein n=1 Tax=Marinilactibacillus psychrotolerans TaxID=191770 RepID=UPI003887DB94